MKINKGKNFIVLCGVFIAVSIVRVVLNDHAYITNIIAFINIIAFWFVFYLIIEQTEEKFEDCISSDTILGENTKLKKKKYFKTMMNIIQILCFVLGAIYMIGLANPIVNDIISFGALFLSIESEVIHEFLYTTIYNKK